uniref:Activin_recp domain-containing protein n=1 Tax=Elaeophora elaphi TaxID=1147741 RepID=A0A0R3RRF3_9BILA
MASFIVEETKAIKCFSNQFENVQEENCGSDGFCFIIRKDSLIRKGNFIVRGCDHSFLCELISETEGVDKVGHSEGMISYCMPDVQYMNFFGYFCCCKDDWCNKSTKVEAISEENILEDIIKGKATEDKWLKLQEIAKEHEITIEI